MKPHSEETHTLLPEADTHVLLSSSVTSCYETLCVFIHRTSFALRTNYPWKLACFCGTKSRFVPHFIKNNNKKRMGGPQ